MLITRLYKQKIKDWEGVKDLYPQHFGHLTRYEKADLKVFVVVISKKGLAGRGPANP